MEYSGEKRYQYRGGRKGFDREGGVICKTCFQKDLEIDRLKQEVLRLTQRLRYQQKAAKTGGVFGNATPSSQIAIKENTLEENRKKKGGAKPGHIGHGRSCLKETSAVEVRELDTLRECPDCHVKLYARGEQERTIVDVTPIKAQRILYRCRRGMCPKCFRVFTSKPSALPKTLYGNELIAQAAVMHYVHGVSLGRICDIFGSEVTESGLIEAFHRLGKRCERALPSLIDQYRKAFVKQADETGWRTDGKRGYAWIFCSDDVSILEFRETRSAKVAQQIFGSERLPGVLVVDRYNAYNRLNCELQYCFAHLLREVEKLQNDFSDNVEVENFSTVLAGLLAESMRLRTQPISDEQYYQRAVLLKEQVQNIIRTPAKHVGIIDIQRIFISKEHRLWHWTKDRNVPAENNRAERELRPTVIARKVSYGSQSERGAKTRSNIMSVLYTVKKRLKKLKSPEKWLKETLDSLRCNPNLELSSCLPTAPPILSTPHN